MTTSTIAAFSQHRQKKV